MNQIAKKKKSNQKLWIWGSIILLGLLIGAAIIKSKSKPKGTAVFTEK